MNRCLLLSIACTLQLVAFCQTDIEKAGLKGSVQFVKLFSNEVKSDGTTVPQNTILNTYNDKGQLTGSTIFRRASNEELGSEFYEFANEQIRKRQISGRINATDIYSYNNKRQLVLQETIPQDNGSFGLAQPGLKKYFSYDAVGNLAEEKTTGNGGDIALKNNYNRDNQKIKTEVWTNGNPSVTIEYSYDKNHRLIKEVRKNSFGKINSETAYKYDAAGHKTESQMKEFDGGKTYISSCQWKYEGDNEVENIENEEGERTVTTSQYEFDKLGNWVIKKVSKNGILWLNQRREISYR